MPVLVDMRTPRIGPEASHARRHIMNRTIQPLFYFCSLLLVLALGCSSGTSTSGTGTPINTNTPTTTWTGQGDGIWRRNAVYAEAVTFDPCNAHQPPSGEYHYHDNPVCLRYQLGDNIVGTNVGTSTATFTEAAAGLVHSPILGWSYDGYPVYGPYGYSDPTKVSTVRRMVSGFTGRSITTRQTLPVWAATAQGLSATLTSTQYGPPVNASYPLGRYIEDFDFTGTGDLDVYNGRFAVTPDFPAGTYAYYVTIDATGAPAFPYYISAQSFGSVTGGAVTSVAEATTQYFANHALQGGSSTTPAVNSWLTKNSLQYAKIISGSNVAAGAATTWTGNTSPVYADIQTVQYSSSYVYINTPGLASHIMGPWYLDAAKAQVFPNNPTNQNSLARFSIIPATATTKTATGGGAQGRWVNGVAMFNNLDFHSWSNTAQADQ
jgi:hypothetical protein